MAPRPQPLYAKDEKALCFHHELLYEAKVLDIKPVDGDAKGGAFQYKVHYKGWKNTWDDWVPQDRLRKFNDDNKELANHLKKEMDAMRQRSQKSTSSHKKKTTGSARDSEERNSSIAPRGQKRARDFEIEKEEAFLNRPAIAIVIPDRLKSLLVDDWEYITKNQQLFPLPARHPASAILDEYRAVEAARRNGGRPGADIEILDEVLAGLKEYFNKALGRILLYRFERQQYMDFHAAIESPVGKLAGKQVADIYGGEHLLRLFVSLPELIAQTNMDQQSVNRLREELSKISMWLSKDAQVARYFNTRYESTSADYKETALGKEEGAEPAAKTASAAAAAAAPAAVSANTRAERGSSGAEVDS